MKQKTALLLVAILAIGLGVLPYSLSLFAGQHTWEDPKEINCARCHQDIYDEIKSPDNKVHISGDWASKCQGCHTTPGMESNGTFFYSYGRGVNTTKNGAHAASTVECVACHSGVMTFNPAKYNSTTDSWAPHSNSLLNPNEAHRNFALAAKSDVPRYYNNGTLIPGSDTGPNTEVDLKGSNAACIACHTHTIINTTWNRPIGYNITIDEVTGNINLTLRTT